MNILQDSIMPAVCMLLFTLVSAAHSTPSEPTAVQLFTGSGNQVVNYQTIGSLTGTNNYVVRLSGANGGISNGNTVVNYGTIISGTSLSSFGSAGIALDASEAGHSNGNIVTNYGTIINQASQDYYSSTGILLNAVEDGETNLNLVTNYGSIQATGTGSAVGIGYFVYQPIGRANQNTIVNNGMISLRTSGHSEGNAFGIGLAAIGGVSIGNKITNNSTLDVSGPGAFGVYISGNTVNANSITNNGITAVSGSYACGIDLDSPENVSSNTITNNRTISVSGIRSAFGISVIAVTTRVNNNVVVNNGTLLVSGSDWNFGIRIEALSGSVTGNIVANYGLIRVSSPAISVGISVAAMAYDGFAVNNVINNYGFIAVSGSSSYGIGLNRANDNIINNWGTIDAGPGGTAIMIQDGTHTVINLNGHSNLTGLIAATGSNNVLNLAFTGISPQTRQALIAELGSKLNGTESEGSFTIRGVTYTYDPLILTLSVSSYQEQAQTPNQAAIGANLDSFTVNPTGDMLTLLNALDQSGSVARGLEQLSPQRYQIYSDIALANANFVTQGIDQRLNNLRTGSESFDTSRLGVSSSSIQSKLGMSNAKGISPCATMAKNGKGVTLKETVTDSKHCGAFLSGEVTFADVGGRDRQQDANFISSGLLGGVDAKITDALTTGLLLSYAHANVDLDSQNSVANVDTYGTGVYAGYHEGNYYGNGLFTYSRNIYESDRVIDIPGSPRTANSRTSGNQYVVNLDGGYDQPVTEHLSVGPFAGLQYVNLSVNSFTENGAGAANLALNEQSVDSLRSRLGVRLELRRAVNTEWTAASEVHLAWQHEFMNDDRAIVSRFSGSGLGAFSVRTSDPERDAVLVGLGLNATYRDTLTTFVDYDVQAGQAHYTEQIVKGGFKWSF